MSDEHRVVASTRLIAGLTLISRILGLAREIAYAQFFGTGPLLSAFRIAFMIPNLSRRLFGEGALSAAFIPIFTRAIRDDDPQRAPRLAGAVFTMLVGVLIAIIVAAEVGILIAHTLAPGITLKLTAIMLPFMGFICVAAFLAGVLNVLGRFAAPAASPILLNVFVIAAIVGGARCADLQCEQLIYVACAGVLAAGIAQVALQLASLKATGFHPKLNRDWSDPQVREVTGCMIPMIVGLSAVQLNTLFDMLIAKHFVADGQGPAILGYAHFTYQLPLGVFGVALATAIFPLLASHAAANDTTRLGQSVVRGLRLSLFIMLPATVGLILIAHPLVVCLFERGAFDADGTTRVSRALALYAVGLTAYAAQHILVRAFYAMKEHRTPARIAASVVAFNLVLNLILVRPLGEAGVALATATSAFVQVGWLTLVLRRYLGRLPLLSIVTTLTKSIIATAAMALCVWFVVAPMSPLPLAHASPLWRIVVAVPTGGVVLAITSHLLRAPELQDLLRNRQDTQQ